MLYTCIHLIVICYVTKQTNFNILKFSIKNRPQYEAPGNNPTNSVVIPWGLIKLNFIISKFGLLNIHVLVQHEVK